MNRLFWGIAFLVLATGSWAQATWRGQAELWIGTNVPAEGFVAASNEFPRDSLLTVENYKTRKTIQVRVVAALPAGSSALIVLSPRAAQALEIKAGEVPLVGVRIDPTGVDRPDNPDPDVNPLANKPPIVAAAPEVPAPVPAATPPAVEPALPLPAIAPEPTRTPLAVADEPEPAAPTTPGKTVFQTTRNPEPLGTETPPVAAAPTTTDLTSTAPETPAVPETPPSVVVAAPPSAPEVTAPVAEAPAPVEAAPAQAPIAAEPAPAAPVVASASPASPVPVKLAPSTAWVAIPGRLEGPVLGQVPLLASLEKGKSYVQLGAWATEADLLATLDNVKSYVPLALYKAEGQKNPWRIVVQSAPKGQLGLLLMLFRSEGLRTAAVVKG